MSNASLLTLSIVTIPEREAYLRRLLGSIAAMKIDPRPHVDVVYNRPFDGSLGDAQERIRGFAPELAADVYFNAGETSIVGGRNLQLSVCRTPLIAFVDDDLTLHGDVVPAVLDGLEEHPVGMLGFRSVKGDTDQQVKPRQTTPSIDMHSLTFAPVQGMLCAGYRALFADIGGFNGRRRFWGEWTELNLRMWRSGFPTAYQMHRGLLRHWEDAPNSPTRNMEGRAQHIVWGLICTALEYDAVDVNEATEVFWRLIEERYLAYGYGDELSPRNVLKTVLELMPQMSAEWANIQAFRAQTAGHKFQFAPFHRFTRDDVNAVYAHARGAIAPYRARLVSAIDRVPRADSVARRGRPTLRDAVGRLQNSLRALRRHF
jgi:hypothetical protein